MSAGDRFGAVVRTLRELKGSYDREDRFSKMRIWIIGAVGFDVVLTLILVLFGMGPALDVKAWYEEGFPSNLIVVQNQGDPLINVEVVVDEKYRARLPRLEVGATGLEIDREFRDGLDFPPPATYQPRELEIRSQGSAMTLELKAQKK